LWTALLRRLRNRRGAQADLPQPPTPLAALHGASASVDPKLQTGATGAGLSGGAGEVLAAGHDRLSAKARSKLAPPAPPVSTCGQGARLGRLLGEDVASGGSGRLLGEVDSDSTLPGSCRSPPRRWQSAGRGAGLGGLSKEQVAATGAGLGCNAGEVPTQPERGMRSKQARAAVAGLTLPGRCSGGRSQAAQWAHARQVECADKEADWFFCG
jgi:hypothetical protein